MLRKKLFGVLVIIFWILAIRGGLHGQNPKESAPSIAFVGVWDRAMPLIERASRETGIPVSFPTVNEVAQGQGLEGIRLLYLLNLEPVEVSPIKERLRKVQKTYPGFRVIPLDHRDVHANLQSAGLLQSDPKISPYWLANGLANMKRLLRYTAITYLGAPGDIEPPVAIPDHGYYYPGREDETLTFEDLRRSALWKKGAPVAALMIQQSFWVTHDLRVIDAEIHALEKEGFNVATLFADTGQYLRKMLLEVKPDIIIEDRHGSSWEGEGKKSLLEELNVPYLRPISMLMDTIQQWLKDPQGLSYVDRNLFLTVQEPKGTIEPIVVGGLKKNIMGFHLHEPLPERIERFARRAKAWITLQQKPNAQKKIALIYYNKYLGKGDLMRGSPTGAFLDGPESLVRFLPRLRKAGYTLDRLPDSAAELLGWIQQSGRNIGPWAQGDLETLADRPGTVLISLSQYEQWFQTKLTHAQREAVTRKFGPPPGHLMVVTRHGTPYIVIPTVPLGNVLLAPQPERGERQDESLLHSRDVPPPHNYLAFYWWLEEKFHADALVHWGTHGSLELLPGKEAGLSRDDWSDVCVGTRPVINLWVMDNLGESTLSRRRSYAALVDHVPPPAVNAGLSPDLQTIHDNIDKWDTLEPGFLREKFRERITKGVGAARLDQTLPLNHLEKRLLTDEEIGKIQAYLHKLWSSITPTTLHVLGQPPDEKSLVPYLVSILGNPFLKRLETIIPVPREEVRFKGDKQMWLRIEAEKLLEKTVIQNQEPLPVLKEDVGFARTMRSRLEKSDAEIQGLLRALSGHYVSPGPGPDPIQNPASVPAGRNLYALNPEAIPARASWDAAVQLVDEMLRTRRPEKVGIDLNGMNTMQDFGVEEAEILYLIGVRPVWDKNGLVEDVKLISREKLGRPRLDVFVAMGGQYKENFPTRVKLLDKAIRLVSQMRGEKDNRVRQGTERLKRRLRALGFSEAQATQFAPARIFGTKPGNLSGTNILYLIPRSGVWKTDNDIASVYIDSMDYVYTGNVWGEKAGQLYRQAIQGVDTIVRVWSSHMTSELSNHHAYEYLGGLSLAVKKLTGREPTALIADVRDPDSVHMRNFEEVLATTLRTELLNRKWIRGMKEHTYAGAGMMAELVKNTFGWAVTRPSSVSNGVWNDIFETYVQDKYALGLRSWFEKVNPYALEETTATLLEAARKGYWKASEQTLHTLAHLYAQLVVQHGPSEGIVGGGNKDLNAFVSHRFLAIGKATESVLVQSFQTALHRAEGNPRVGSTRVRGFKLEKKVIPRKKAMPPQRATPLTFPNPSPDNHRLAYLMGAGVFLLFFIGMWKRAGTPS